MRNFLHLFLRGRQKEGHLPFRWIPTDDKPKKEALPTTLDNCIHRNVYAIYIHHFPLHISHCNREILKLSSSGFADVSGGRGKMFVYFSWFHFQRERHSFKKNLP